MQLSSKALPATEDTTGGERVRLEALTGLRFFAALAVVLDHYWTAFIWWDPARAIPSANPQPMGWKQLAHIGGLGVDCFFVLSGFILAYTYVMPHGSLRGTPGAFWIARIARIYPIYVVGLCLDALPFWWRPHHLGGLLGAAATTPLLLQAWVPSLGTWNSWDPPSWSLSVEALFYLVFPLIILALGKWPSKALWTCAGLSAGIFVTLPAVLVYLIAASHPGLLWWADQVLYYNPLMRLPEFILGAVLGIMCVRGHLQPRQRTEPKVGVSVRDIAIIALIAAIVASQFVPLPAYYPTRVLALPLFAAVIALLSQGRGTAATLLSRPIFVWLGEISYAIYILHVPIWAWLSWAVQAAPHLWIWDLAILPVYLGTVLVAAGLSYRFIERPTRAALKSRWATWEARRRPSSGFIDRSSAAGATFTR